MVHGLLVDLAGRHQQLKDFSLPRRQQQVGVDLRQAEEGAIGSKRTVGGNRVNVRMSCGAICYVELSIHVAPVSRLQRWEAWEGCT